MVDGDGARRLRCGPAPAPEVQHAATYPMAILYGFAPSDIVLTADAECTPIRLQVDCPLVPVWFRKLKEIDVVVPRGVSIYVCVVFTRLLTRQAIRSCDVEYPLQLA